MEPYDISGMLVRLQQGQIRLTERHDLQVSIVPISITIQPISTAQEWVERHLVTWCAWKHGWYGPDGLPSESCAGENYQSLDRESEKAYEKLDFWIAETCQVVIDDIGKRNPAQKAALYRAYDVVAAFQFPRGNYQELLREAKAGVFLGLKRRSVWLGD